MDEEVKDLASVRSVRAVCSLLILLGHPGAWPVDDREDDLLLGVAKLDQCFSVEQDPEFKSIIAQERDLLAMMARDEDLPKELQAISALFAQWYKV